MVVAQLGAVARHQTNADVHQLVSRMIGASLSQGAKSNSSVLSLPVVLATIIIAFDLLEIVDSLSLCIKIMFKNFNPNGGIDPTL